VFRAQGQGDEAAQARFDLLVRYHDAVSRYLKLKLSRDPHAVGEILSNFANAVLEGERFLLRAGQKPGRFRNYLQRVLSNMIADYYRARSREPQQWTTDSPEPADARSQEADEADLRACWKQEIINQAWKTLEEVQRQTGQLFYTACRVNHEHADKRSAEKAEIVTAEIGKTITAEYFRQLVHRGEEKLTESIVAEVARSLKPFYGDGVTRERIEEELLELDPRALLSCKKALDQYARGAGL
jgi:DNA-directed RNA polymerase specialized sigma24 family protein